MNCPKCGYNTRVIDSRLRFDENTRRRRECVNCGYRFSTVEMDVEIYQTKYKRKSYEYCFLYEEYSGQNCKKCPFKKRCLDEE